MNTITILKTPHAKARHIPSAPRGRRAGLHLSVLAALVLSASACVDTSPTTDAPADGWTFDLTGNGKDDTVPRGNTTPNDTANGTTTPANPGPETVDELCWWEDCDADHWCVPGTLSACKPVQCDLPTTAPGDTAWQVTQLTILPMGQGCDLNNDGEVDNQLGGLNELDSKLAGNASEAILSGRYTQLLRPTGEVVKGGFILEGLAAQVDPKAFAAGCVPGDMDATKRCPVQIRKESYTLDAEGTCPVRTRCVATLGELASVAITCNEGAPQAVISSPQVTIPGYSITMNGTLPRPAGSDGSAAQPGVVRVCGMLRWSDIDARLDLVPAEVWKNLGVTAPNARNLLHQLMPGDVAVGAGPELDGISFAVEMKLDTVTVVGHAQ